MQTKGTAQSLIQCKYALPCFCEPYVQPLIFMSYASPVSPVSPPLSGISAAVTKTMHMSQHSTVGGPQEETPLKEPQKRFSKLKYLSGWGRDFQLVTEPTSSSSYQVPSQQVISQATENGNHVHQAYPIKISHKSSSLPFGYSRIAGMDGWGDPGGHMKQSGPSLPTPNSYDLKPGEHGISENCISSKLRSLKFQLVTAVGLF